MAVTTKADFYSSVAEYTVKNLTNSRENWTDFLTTAGRLYKYSFPDQVMIHAQRPDAVAVAPIEVWNNPMNRYVRRGSKGIALLDNNGGKMRLKYVFDYADTEDGRANPRRPFLWQLQPDNMPAVSEAIAEKFVPMKGDMADVIGIISYNLAENYCNGNARDIKYSVESSYLDELDDDSIMGIFGKALITSATYSVISRCGIDVNKYFGDDDFDWLYNFNTAQSITALGTAVSELSEQILREIEVAVKKYEREKGRVNYEPNRIYQERRLSAPEPDVAGADRDTWQIRLDEAGLSDEAQENPVQSVIADGTDSIALGGDGQDGSGTSESDDAGVDNEKPAAGQINEPNGVDGTHEYAENAGGGIYTGRTDLQLDGISASELEQAQMEWDGFISDYVITNETVINAATNSDKQNTLTEIEKAIRQAVNEIKSAYINSTNPNRGQLVNEVDNYYNIMLTPAIAEQLYQAVMQSDPNEKGSQVGNLFSVEQMPIFPTVEEQQTAIRAEEIQNIVENPPIVAIEQSDIDEALRRWNGDSGSKQQIYEYMRGHSRELATANYLKEQYGGDLPHFTVEKDGAEPLILSWAKVQRHIARLIDENNFIDLTEPETIHNYTVGDTVYLENNRHFIIDDISDSEIRLTDPSLIIPITRSMSVDDFEWLLHDNPRNTETPQKVQTPGQVAYEKYISAKEKYPDHIALIELGDFFEMQGADAEFAVNNLGYTSAVRDINGQKVPFVGIPSVHINELVTRIHELGRNAVLLYSNGSMLDYPMKSDTTKTEPLKIDRTSQIEYSDQQTLFDIFDEPEIVEAQEKPAISEPKTPVSAVKAVNFRITDEHIGEGGAKTKFRYNLDAINTLHDIEFEKRSATPDEQQILSRYVGWGGLPQAFDPDKAQWTNEYLELNAALSPEEWESARASTLNAHYTSPTVINAMYDTIGHMGFKTGNILEPSMGVGNFFGLLPDSMAKSRLYGVELDSVTGRIAKQLYPNANIQITGFERTNFPDNFFDVSLGNIPFGDYSVVDSKYNKYNFHIHDYFFCKTLDKVRPGGIVAFVTSKGTLDKKNPEVRRYLAQRAELLGAVRLPNDAFLKNAGTQVTTDIIFLQKRDKMVDIEPDWVHLGLTDDNIPVNSYFAENPHMILGTMGYDNTLYGNKNDTTCNPIAGADLSEQLRKALSNITGKIEEVTLDDIPDQSVNKSIPADPLVKNFSYALVTPATGPDNVDGRIYARKVGVGEVYYRENSSMYPVDLPKTTLDRIRGMIKLRDCVNELIQYQIDDFPDEVIQRKQAELTRLYSSFVLQYGIINNRVNNQAFSDDSSYYLLCSLEILDENGKLERKADIFTKRTIRQKTVITHVDTASEALAVSIGERACVDMAYMTELTGKDEATIAAELQGVIFRNPLYGIGGKTSDNKFLTADEYLSGNVREKLEWAKRSAEIYPDDYNVNVKALEAAQPKDLEASEISVRLGVTWIDKDYINQFMYELLKTASYMRNTIQMHYSELTGEWQVKGARHAPFNDILGRTTYGTSSINAYQILQETLNLRDVRIYDIKVDADGKKQRILNKKETMLAQQKQDSIKQAFRDWIFKDPDRRQTLVKLYNERFNSVRPREYDGSHLNFVGKSDQIKLEQHQLNAIAHIIYGGNTLLAHEVGAGKTFKMVAAAMESKRLGLCRKSLISVPNHLTEQWAAEFLRLYPSANILVANEKDFETKNRKKFCAKIASGDYDAVIIGHSQLTKIPVSKERQEQLLNEQLDEIITGIDEMQAMKAERFTIKQLEKTKKRIEAKLEKLNDNSKKDTVVTFEQLGVDRLFIDEAHLFKNLLLFTKMHNVAGLSTTDSQKSSDLFMKCRYLDELTGGKGIVFATGTPVSNSMTELYTNTGKIQRSKFAEFINA